MRRALKLAAAILALAAIGPASAQWVPPASVGPPAPATAIPSMAGLNLNNDSPGIMSAGVPWIRLNNQTQGISAVIHGRYAGVNLPNGQGMVAIGELAMASQTDGTGEDVVISPWGMPYVTTMHSTVAIGEHVGGTEINPIACTAVGADVIRDSVGCAGGTFIGSGSVIEGNMVDDTVVGSNSFHGTAASVVIGPGTPNPGDVITINLTTNDPVNSTGFPVTVTYTVVAGDTTALALAQHVHAALSASPAMAAVKYTKPAIPQVPGRITTLLVMTAGDDFDSLGNQYLGFHTDGTQTTGMQLVVAASCSGVCPNAVSAIGASAPLHNTIIGRGVLAGLGMTNPQYNVVVGHGATPDGTSMTRNTILGTLGAQALATGNSNLLVGYQVAKLLSTGNSNQCFGDSSCSRLVTGSSNIILATSNAAAQDVDIASRSNLINIGGVKRWTNVSTAVPTLSGGGGCGTSPSVDANANMASGTVTVGSGSPVSCAITFATAYRVFNHCRVTAQAANANLAYSYTLAAIVVTGTGLAGKIDYDCDGN